MSENGKENHRIAVIGAGAWGTTLADLIGTQGYDVGLWCLEQEVAKNIQRKSINETYLPGITLNTNVRASNDLAEVLEGKNLILFVVPSQHSREIASQCKPNLTPGAMILSASKGFEIATFKRITVVLSEEWAGQDYSLGVLSGPNLSREIVNRKPAVTLVAGTDEKLVANWQKLLSTQHFRVYGGSDVIGTELGGALKNIYAIAAGITTGFNFGHNTLASLITRSLKEMVRLGVHLGAKPETFHGASGIGDLICTAFSELSRNHTVGKKLASGEKLEDMMRNTTHVAEGVYTTQAVHRYLADVDVEMPIAEEVYRVLFDGLDPQEGVRNLMGRSLKTE